jgi:hypothetical protein
MPLGLSLISFDVGKAAPLIGVAALGVAAWWIWNKSEKARKETQANASPAAQYQTSADMAFLQSFTGGSSVPVQGAGPVTDPLLPTYTAPGNPAQNFTLPAPASQIGASTTSNGI